MIRISRQKRERTDKILLSSLIAGYRYVGRAVRNSFFIRVLRLIYVGGPPLKRNRIVPLARHDPVRNQTGFAT